MQTIEKYFPGMDELSRRRFAALDGLYRDWNDKINVISRKDIDNLYEHHILHSLAIAKAVQFKPGEKVLDLGTGGGFPGIPLAIMFPQTQFTLCDSIGKKVKVASAVAEALELDNVKCVNARVETLPESYDYIVSRAVAQMSDLVSWTGNKFSKAMICLKGGDVEAEALECSNARHIPAKKFTICDISLWFPEEYYREKKLMILSK